MHASMSQPRTDRKQKCTQPTCQEYNIETHAVTRTNNSTETPPCAGHRPHHRHDRAAAPSPGNSINAIQQAQVCCTRRNSSLT